MKKSELIEKIVAGIDHLMKSPAIAAREDILREEVRNALVARAAATSKRPWSGAWNAGPGSAEPQYGQLVAMRRVVAAVHDTALVTLVDELRARRCGPAASGPTEAPRVEEPAKAEPASTPTSPGKRGGARKAAAVQAFLDALAPHAEAFGPALSKYVRDAVLDPQRGEGTMAYAVRWQSHYAARFLGVLTMGELHRARTHLIPAFVGLTRDEQYARMCASHALRRPHDPLPPLPALPVGEEAAKAEATWTATAPDTTPPEAPEGPGEHTALLGRVSARIYAIRDAHNTSLDDATNALIDSYRMPWQRAHGTNLVGGLPIEALRTAAAHYKGQTPEELSKNVHLAKAIARSREWSPEQRTPTDGIEKKEGWTAEPPKWVATPEVERATAAAFQAVHEENAQLRAKVANLEKLIDAADAVVRMECSRSEGLRYLVTRLVAGDTVPPALVQAALNA